MKILVGILHTIENEFEECLSSLNQQTYQNYEYFVLHNLPDRQAHDELYLMFMDNNDRFDLFIKLDADMVIIKKDLFKNIVEVFKENPDIDLFTIYVHDFYTDRIISGLHTFRHTVRWEIRQNNVFTDDHLIPSWKTLQDKNKLAPAAYQCKNPSPYQAFHTGMHRGIKIRQAYRNLFKRFSWYIGHVDNVKLCWENFCRKRDIRLGYASLGAELAIKGDFCAEHINYTNSYSKEIFKNKYSKLTPKQIKLMVYFLRIQNRIFSPILVLITIFRFSRKIINLLPIKVSSFIKDIFLSKNAQR